MSKVIHLLILVLLFCLSRGLPAQTPIIGIYTQTNEDDGKTSYISTSYVKFIEMSGAQVVPIYSFNSSEAVLDQLRKVNGVLIPGGAMEYHMEEIWTRNTDVILKYAIQQNDQGNIFPIFGTCMGHQLLAYLTANYTNSIFTTVHGNEAIVEAINIVDEGYMYATFSSALKSKATKGTGIFYFNHVLAVTLDTYNSSPALKNFWKITATATTSRNQRIIASFEAKKYPFYGVQYHPEKNPFEWRIYADHSIEAVEATQILANRFVEMARKNKNSYPSVQQFMKDSIYNFQTHPTTTMSYNEIYIFNETVRRSEHHLRKSTM